MKHLRILNALYEISLALEPVGGSRVAAAIVLGRDVVSIGTNKRKTHPFQAQHARNEQSIFLHAENDAINKALKLVDVKDLTRATLYICRSKWLYTSPYNCGYTGWGLSKPCSGCDTTINKYKISRTIYTLEGFPSKNNVKIIGD